MSMFRGLLHIESHAAGRENEIGNMVPQTCIKVFFQKAYRAQTEKGVSPFINWRTPKDPRQ
jgi:hypothetical protein